METLKPPVSATAHVLMATTTMFSFDFYFISDIVDEWKVEKNCFAYSYLFYSLGLQLYPVNLHVLSHKYEINTYYSYLCPEQSTS